MIKSSKHNKLLFIKVATSLVALGFAFTTNVLAMQTYEDSSEDIVKGSTLSIKQELKQRAKKGDAQAQYDLGILYRKGVGDNSIAKKSQKGLFWLEKAADQDHVDSQIEIVKICLDFDEDGISQDTDKAMQNLTKALKTNNAKAQNLFGWMYDNGKGVDKDEKEAVKCYRLAADQGCAKGRFNLGYAYDKGKGVSKDKKAAVRWYKRAAAQGFSHAQNNLGISYLKGTGVKRSCKKAEMWLRSAAEQGDDIAQFNLGMLFKDGLIVGTFIGSSKIKSDKREAYKWLEKAALQGNAEAAALLPAHATSES